MARKSDSEHERLDDAARAGWLYYIAGNTQDEIANRFRKMTASVLEPAAAQRIMQAVDRLDGKV